MVSVDLWQVGAAESQGQRKARVEGPESLVLGEGFQEQASRSRPGSPTGPAEDRVGRHTEINRL